MKGILWVGLGLCFVACTGHPRATQAKPGPGILGGDAVSADSVIAGSVVGLVAQSSSADYLCTGVLIANDTVLTAAHCGVDLQQGEIVFSTNLSTSGGEDRRPVESVNVNPQFNTVMAQLQSGADENSVQNWGDLAILKFSGGLPEGYAPAQIGAAGDLSDGMPVIFAGFGQTDPSDQNPSSKLRAVQVAIDNVAFSETEFSVDQSQGYGVCHGDSGGPAFVQDGDRLLLMGIVSRGTDEDCQTGSIETKVSAFMDWIRASVQGT